MAGNNRFRRLHSRIYGLHGICRRRCFRVWIHSIDAARARLCAMFCIYIDSEAPAGLIGWRLAKGVESCIVFQRLIQSVNSRKRQSIAEQIAADAGWNGILHRRYIVNNYSVESPMIIVIPRPPGRTCLAQKVPVPTANWIAACCRQVVPRQHPSDRAIAILQIVSPSIPTMLGGAGIRSSGAVAGMARQRLTAIPRFTRSVRQIPGFLALRGQTR